MAFRSFKNLRVLKGDQKIIERLLIVGNNIIPYTLNNNKIILPQKLMKLSILKLDYFPPWMKDSTVDLSRHFKIEMYYNREARY